MLIASRVDYEKVYGKVLRCGSGELRSESIGLRTKFGTKGR